MAELNIDLSFDPIALAINFTVKVIDLPEFKDMGKKLYNVIGGIAIYGGERCCDRFMKYEDVRLCDIAIAYQRYGAKNIERCVMGAGAKSVYLIETAMNSALKRLWNERNKNIETGAQLSEENIL